MAARIRRVEYYYLTDRSLPTGGYEVLSQLAAAGINLLAFSAIPTGPTVTQLVLFPEDPALLTRFAGQARATLVGPQHALLVQGDDELGALAGIHERLHEADIPVFASSGVTDGRGGFGYVIHLRPHDIQRAEAALGI